MTGNAIIIHCTFSIIHFLWNWEHLAFFEGRHDNHCLGAGYLVNFIDYIEHQSLIRRNVFGDYFQQEVARAGNVVAFNDFGDLIDPINERHGSIFFMTNQRNHNECGNAKTDLIPIQLGMVALNDP